MERRLVVNGDDFGMSPGVNAGIIEAHERGIVTSASLMVRWPDAGEAAALARAHADLSVGLHIDLGEWIWGPQGRYALYKNADPENEEEVATEVGRQLETFRRLMGAEPTHIDSHQHIHKRPGVGPILEGLAASLNVPLRLGTPGIHFVPDFYGQVGKGDPAPEHITADALCHILAGLSPGVSELMCHPGYGDGLATPYRDERIVELQVLCDPAVRRFIEHEKIELISFRDVNLPLERGQ